MKRYHVRGTFQAGILLESDSLRECLAFIAGRQGFWVWDAATRYVLPEPEAHLKAMFE